MPGLTDLLDIAITGVIDIGGHQIPLKAFGGLAQAIPQVIEAIATGKPASEVIMEIAPEILPLIEALANIAFPGAGDGIALAVLLLSASHKMTPEEEQVFFDRQTSFPGGG